MVFRVSHASRPLAGIILPGPYSSSDALHNVWKRHANALLGFAGHRNVGESECVCVGFWVRVAGLVWVGGCGCGFFPFVGGNRWGEGGSEREGDVWRSIGLREYLHGL